MNLSFSKHLLVTVGGGASCCRKCYW